VKVAVEVKAGAVPEVVVMVWGLLTGISTKMMLVGVPSMMVATVEV
jgi:hypothetical protein